MNVPPGAQTLRDALDRPLRDLRVSVTDRCNFRCTYCLPRDKTDASQFLPRAELLSFEEIDRAVGCFSRLGVKKVRLTGGEPLLRKDLPLLVRMLRRHGVEIALTTNGVLLPSLAKPLRDAGLDRLTVSLDALDEGVFQAVCDAPGFSVADVLGGIKAAERAGFSSLKINCAVRRGANESEVVPLARYFRKTPHIIRFIEFMDVGTKNSWLPSEVVTAEEILTQLGSMEELVPLAAQYHGEVARRFSYRAGPGEVGVIASVTEPFCGDCTRARLSSDGRLFACLFAAQGMDLRNALRSGEADESIAARIAGWWQERGDRYSELRRNLTPTSPRSNKSLPLVGERVEMSFIGG